VTRKRSPRLPAETRRLIDLLDATGQAVIATDAAGTIIHWGDHAERIYGWKAREVRGRNIVEVTPSKLSRAEADHIMRSLSAGEIWSGTFEVRDRRGRSFRASVTDVPVVKAHRTTAIVGLSSRADTRSKLGETLREFAAACQRLWPGQVHLTLEPEMANATADADDTHMTHLLALLLQWQADVLDRGERIDITGAIASAKMLDQFALSRKRFAYVRIARSDAVAAGSLLGDLARQAQESKYAAMLVSRAGGRLFTTATAAASRATHLFLPTGI